jgi:hypothetical protein
MRKIVILGAAAALALAGPAMARDMKGHHRHMAKQHTMQQQPQQQANAGWNGWNTNNDWNRRGSTGFWPTDVAAGAVGAAAGIAGAAVGTAGAIATAPFRNDAYAYAPGQNGYRAEMAYDHGPNGFYGNWDTYAARNGFVCRPGTFFKGSDGRQHICQ